MIARSPIAAATLIGSLAVHASILVGISPRAASSEPPATPEPSPVVDVDLSCPPPAPAESLPGQAALRPEPSRLARISTREAIARSPVARPSGPASQSDATSAPAPAPLHFTIDVVPQGRPAAGSDRAEGVSEAQGDGVYGEEGVDARPRLLAWRAPRYPDAAASAGVEVDVPVDIVIDTAGTVIDVRLPKHFGYGLDEAATAAARSYRFSRGMKAGRPVRVRMRCTVMFRLN
jgi:TonB family protein